MKKKYQYFRYFALFFITMSIVLNLILCYNEKNMFCLISLRNIFLYIFLICYIKYNKWTLSLLILINLSFWYYFFIEKSNQSFFNNPIIYFTNSLKEFLKYASLPKLILNLVSSVPLIINILIILY